MVQPASLLFLLKDGQILLAMKKRGFGAGRYNGVGGKPEAGETIEQTAVRECQEEIGVTPRGLQHVASLTFNITYSDQHEVLKAEAFTAREWEGEPIETEEMAPQWFSLAEIPYEQMWADDKYWLPEVLNGNFVTAEFTFDEDDNVLDKTLEIHPLKSF